MPPPTLGWAVLVAAAVAPLPLAPFLGAEAMFVGWFLTPLGLGALARSGAAVRGLRGAFAAWGVLMGLVLVGGSLTLGTSAGPIASVGGGDELVGLTYAFLFVAPLPLVLLLWRNTEGPARRFAAVALALMALALVQGFLLYFVPPSRAAGAYAHAGSLLVLVAILAYLASAAALGLGRSALRRAA